MRHWSFHEAHGVCRQCGRTGRLGDASRLLNFGQFCNGACKQAYIAGLTLAPTCVWCSTTIREAAEVTLRHWCSESCRDEYVKHVEGLEIDASLRKEIKDCEFGFRRPPEMQTLDGYTHSNDADTWAIRLGMTDEPIDWLLDTRARRVADAEPLEAVEAWQESQ